jgi:hypothetical protein
MEKRPEKFIPQRQHHPRLHVAVQKPNSLSHHVKEVADVIAAIIIFIETTMKRPNPPFLLVREEEEEPNPQYQKTWHEKN